MNYQNILVILLQQHDLATKTTRSDVFPEKKSVKTFDVFFLNKLESLLLSS